MLASVNKLATLSVDPLNVECGNSIPLIMVADKFLVGCLIDYVSGKLVVCSKNG